MRLHSFIPYSIGRKAIVLWLLIRRSQALDERGLSPYKRADLDQEALGAATSIRGQHRRRYFRLQYPSLRPPVPQKMAGYVNALSWHRAAVYYLMLYSLCGCLRVLYVADLVTLLRD